MHAVYENIVCVSHWLLKPNALGRKEEKSHHDYYTQTTCIYLLVLQDSQMCCLRLIALKVKSLERCVWRFLRRSRYYTGEKEHVEWVAEKHSCSL